MTGDYVYKDGKFRAEGTVVQRSIDIENMTHTENWENFRVTGTQTRMSARM